LQFNIHYTFVTLSYDSRHLKEDMGPMADQLDFSKMTEQEIEFHYFQYVLDIKDRFISMIIKQIRIQFSHIVNIISYLQDSRCRQ